MSGSRRDRLIAAAEAAGATEGDTAVVIVDAALAQNPRVTAATIRRIVREAAEEHAADRAHDAAIDARDRSLGRLR